MNEYLELKVDILEQMSKRHDAIVAEQGKLIRQNTLLLHRSLDIFEQRVDSGNTNHGLRSFIWEADGYIDAVKHCIQEIHTHVAASDICQTQIQDAKVAIAKRKETAE